MSWNRSPLAFGDIAELFERALNAPKGIKIVQKSRAEVISLRARFNYYRKLNRKENAETFPRDHRMHGASVYDTLILRIPPKGGADDCTLFIEHRDATSFEVEDLQ